MSTPSPFTVTKDGCHFEVKVDAHYISDEEMQTLRRYIATLNDEKAKLRELVRDMHRAICCLVVLGDDYAGEHEDELCVLDDRMRELGVGVEP